MLTAIIFDMDGVIADTHKFHTQVEVQILRKYGLGISAKEIDEKYAGINDRDFFTQMFSDHNLTLKIDDIIKDKWTNMMVVARNNVAPIPGAIQLIDDLKKDGYKLAVASSSPLHFIELVLAELKIRDRFNTIVSGEEVAQGKPNPEIFLLAARRLGVEPASCLVIEDAVSGMSAAKGGGMKCIGLVRDKQNKNYPADFVVTSLNELSCELISHLN